MRAVPKRVANPKARVANKEGTEQLNYKLESTDGTQHFQLYTRQNLRAGMEDNFSCGLNMVKPNGESLTLCRYNGRAIRTGIIWKRKAFSSSRTYTWPPNATSPPTVIPKPSLPQPNGSELCKVRSIAWSRTVQFRACKPYRTNLPCSP